MIFNMSTGGASTADKVKYNNTESGLQSTDVQGAIDEVNSSLVETLISQDETYRFSKIGKRRRLVLYGMDGYKFLNLNFNQHKPVFNSGELCYYVSESSNSYYTARVVVKTDGTPGGTILISSSDIVTIGSGSTGKLYGTIEWYVS